MNRYRLKFSKTGRIKFIGHLDLLKVFQRATLRAKLPICYSEGFNPHQKTSFALPLGVGVESVGEYVEIDLTTTMDEQAILTQLNAAMPAGVVFTEAKPNAPNQKTAAAELAAAIYEVTFGNVNALEESLTFLLNQEELWVDKKTKKGIKQTDIRSDIFQLEISKETKHTVRMLLAAGSNNNLKPNVVAERIVKQMGVTDCEIGYMRIDLLKKEGETFASLSNGG